jgi:ankyrin repeat protein
VVKKNECDLIDLQSGKYVEHKKLADNELEVNLSGKDQVYPTTVWQDKNKGDNYFKPKMLHKDNNYIFVKGLSRFWALGEDGLYDQLRRSQKLSEYAINANQPVKDESTPLMRALKHRQTDVVATLLNTPGLNLDAVALDDQKSVVMLLERRARTDTVTKDGKTLLHAMFEPKPGRLTSDPANIELMKLLAARKDIDINKEDGEGMTPMLLAIDNVQPVIVKAFLTRSDLDVNKRTAAGDYLNRAIRHSRLRHGYEIAMMLLDREEIDVNVPYYQGETLVHMGWYNSGIGTQGLELAKKILSRRPDLNREDESGETPLVHNINQNRPEMVRLLAGIKGVDLNRVIRDEERTPLGHARYIKNAGMVDILQKAGAREFNFVGNEDRTPEGIPQTLLQNESASQAIIFYRGYLLSTTDKTLKFLREKKTDDAVQLQEFILDEIIAEMGDYSMPKYSSEQRRRAISTFTAIRDHYKSHPRTESAWFKALPADKKAGYETLDMMRDEIIKGKYHATPDGELVKHSPMVPILILRDYMARNSIQALGMMKKGKTAKAEEFLKEIIILSDKTGVHKQ